MIWPIGPIFWTGLELLEHVLEREAGLAELLLHLLGLLDVEGLLRPLDEGQDVAHAEDPAGEPVRVEDLEGVGLLAGAEELDRDPGHGRDAERGAAAGVAIDLGEDESGHGHGRDERLGDADGLLAGHGVDDEQGLDRLDGRVDGGDLLHEGLVDAEPARGVEDHDVADLALGRLDALAGDVRDAGPERGAVDRDVELLAEGLELVGSRRAVGVRGDEQRAGGPA